MAEYIEREAALYRAKSFLANHIDGIVAEHAQLPYETCNATEFARGYERGAIDAVKVVLSTPAADVEVVKHGRWEKRFCHKVFGYYQYICSECKDDEYWNNNVVNRRDNYCPNCGAKMDGVEQIIGEGHNETKVWG